MHPLQAIADLNHAGIWMSYDQTWEYLRQLTSEPHYKTMVKNGHWLWVYDNFNLHQKWVRHARKGESTIKYYIHNNNATILIHPDWHHTMCNVTTWLAIEIDVLPPYNFSWEDCTPQKMRNNLTLDDILPNVEDGRILIQRAVQYTTNFGRRVSHIQQSYKFQCVQVQNCPNETSV